MSLEFTIFYDFSFHFFIKQAYSNSDKNYYGTSEDQYSFKPIQPINTNVYENRDLQFCSTESYNSSSSNVDSSSFGIDNLAQFSNNNAINNNNSITSNNNNNSNVNTPWLQNTENKSYPEQLWKNDDILFDSCDKDGTDFNEDKPLPPSPTMDEDVKNSSRSESESSDELSFGEALATGLIPPEIAARMNIELINQPKAVIESFYGHSPGEVYTIPEEEDEICSPTGADGVTSLRKQRMASGRFKFFGQGRNPSQCRTHEG